jgi:outer membrane protein assembly factor BamB
VAPAALCAERSLPHPIVFCQLPVEETVELEARAGGMLRADYGNAGRLIVLEPDGTSRNLVPDFYSACDPDVSFDGEKILFAGKRRPSDPWNIWEIDTGGSDLRQVTREQHDSRAPIYLSTLYTITSTEPWYTILFVRDDGVLNEEGSAPGTSLYSVRLDGSEQSRITFNLSNEGDPFLMPDGLVLFAGWQHRVRKGWPRGRISLFGVHTDGIDYSLFGGLQGSRIQHMPAVGADGTVLFVEADRVDWDGATLRTQRPHHTYQRLTGPGEGLFHSPSPLADGSFLVSRRPVDGSGTHGIYRLDTADGRLDLLYDAPDSHELDAMAIAVRSQPDGRSSTVRSDSPTGKLYCLNAYEGDEGMTPKLEPGTIRRVRVIEGLAPAAEKVADGRPESSALGTRRPTAGRRLLGEAPVEADGSFHVDIPADLPVQLQILDDDGMALSTCGWIWTRPREFRGCIGCHEDPELTPENRFVAAAGRPADQLTPPAESRRSITFKDQVMPILETRCAHCHGDPEARFAFLSTAGETRAKDAFAALMEAEDRYIDPGRARTSYLVWLLFGRDTSRPWDRDETAPREVPASHLDLLDGAERRTIVEWIDLGARWGMTPPAGIDLQEDSP